MPSASENLAPETPPSRGISSRLLTMKFMQRAVAAESNSGQNSPQSADSSTKRRKMDSPLTGEFHSFDEAAIQAAKKQQEATRQAALSKHQVELADTPWVLSGFEAAGLGAQEEDSRQNVTVVGFTNIDATEGQENSLQRVKAGRQRTGDFKSKGDESTNTVPAKSDDESDDSVDSGDEDDYNDGSIQAGHGGERTRKHADRRRSAESSRARELREKRKKSVVNLNNLTSISGGASISGGGGGSGFSNGGGSSRPSNFACYSCGNQGHKSADCPTKQQRHGSSQGRGGKGGRGGKKRKSSE